jgi:hypothetical protein
MSSYATRASWARRAYWALDNRIRTDIWIVQGCERVSGEPLRFCYAGTEPNKNYLISIALKEEFQEQHLGRKWIWQINTIAKNLIPGCDAFVLEIEQLYQNVLGIKKKFWIPCWVKGVVTIPLTVSGTSAKSDKRYVKKNRLSYSVTREISEFDRFYEKMYVPFVQQQHKDKAFYADLEEMRQKAADGTCELLLIWDQTQAIAGELIVLEATMPRLWSFGVLNGDLTHFNKRVVAASILFSSDYLSKKGYEKMSLGDSRAFVNDGVLQFKMKWGLQLSGVHRKGYLLRLLGASTGLLSFLNENPFFCFENGELSFVAFVGNKSAPGQSNIATALENARSLGVEKSQFYSCTEHLEDVVEGNPVSIRSAKDLFA